MESHEKMFMDSKEQEPQQRFGCWPQSSIWEEALKEMETPHMFSSVLNIWAKFDIWGPHARFAGYYDGEHIRKHNRKFRKPKQARDIQNATVVCQKSDSPTPHR